MKIDEILNESLDPHLLELKQRLDAGEMVDIANANTGKGGYDWSMLSLLGYAKRQRRAGPTRETVEYRWVYTGPTRSAVRALTRGSSNPEILMPGQGTEWVEVDVS